MERPLVRRRHAREDYDFGWAPLRASQLASPQVSSSPSRHEDRERRRRRRRNSGDRDRDSSGRRDGRSKGGRDDRRALPTDYRGALAKFAPPAPHALLKKIGSKDVQGLGKVRVVLRVSPAVSLAEGEAEVVTLDKRRRQVTLVDPQTRQAQESRVGVAAPKMFAFDQVYTQEDSQNEVVSGAVVDVLHAVLAGNDG
ncbi:kinesin-like protein CG14535, partial [Penaeus vannamei]|uniref:kinesin-like protein CG14535 n=1 Tax=Penaeus vannamei TaxID=6689 RepID=UPI00387F3C45